MPIKFPRSIKQSKKFNKKTYHLFKSTNTKAVVERLKREAKAKGLKSVRVSKTKSVRGKTVFNVYARRSA